MKLVNIVILCDTSHPILFKQNKRFSGKIIKKSNVCFLLFRSGKVIMTGVKNIKQAIKILTKILKKYNSKAGIKSFKIINMTFSGIVNYSVTWEKVKNQKCFKYEPEIFPALYWKKDSITVMLFHSGKYVLTGVKDYFTAQLIKEEFLNSIKPILKSI